MPARCFDRRSCSIVCFLLGIMLCAAALPALATAPPRPGELDQYRQDGTFAKRLAFMQQTGNERVSPDLVRRKLAQVKAGGKTGLEKFPYHTGLPSKGTVRIFVLPVEFPDYPHHVDTWTIKDKLFGAADAAEAPFDSMSEFYKRSSYGQLTIQGDVLPWYEAAHNRDYYTDSIAALVNEAMAANYKTDFSVYDNNADGVLDYFIVIWTGPNTGWGSFWWAWNSSLSGGNFDGKSAGNYSFIWESNPQGSQWFDTSVAIHETGHALGLPDYYDYTKDDNNRGGAGGLDMMDANWCDHNAFSKWLLDWLTPTVIANTGVMSKLTLHPSASHAEAVAIMPGMSSASPFSEYYLVQNRARGAGASNDRLVPAEGLVIWHVDARLNSTSDGFRYNNSSTTFKLLKLMQADGANHIEYGKGGAEPADFYLPNRCLSPISNPDSSKDYLVYPPNPSKTRTGVTVFNIVPITFGWPLPPPPGTQSATFVIADATTDWIDVGSAVDATHLTWDASVSAGATWVGQKQTWNYDGDAAQSIGVGDGQSASLTTQVTGPGPLTFKWKVSSEYRKDWLRFYIDGAEQSAITSNVDWTARAYNIAPGKHTLQWKYIKDASGSAGSDCGWVDKVNYPFVPFETAVDNDATTWVHSGSMSWFGQGDEYTWGGSAAASGSIADGQFSQFTGQVTGPCAVRFFWKVSSEKNADTLRLLVDGIEKTRISGEVDWTSFTQTIAAGQHAIAWQYIKNASGKAGADRAWVDKIDITIPTLAEGVDNVVLPWTSTPLGAWFFTTQLKHDGVDAVQCPNLAKNQKGVLSTKVVGPGTLKFYWMESDTHSPGWLDFWIDGDYQASKSDGAWEQKTFTIAEGRHKLEWQYTMEGDPPDTAAIDQVEFTPDWLTLAEALDAPLIKWETWGNPAWIAQEKVSSFGMDAAQSGAIGNDLNTFLEGMVAGPALLSFDWKVSSQPRGADYFYHDDLEFYIDDIGKGSINGEVGWETKQYLLSKGPHKITWNYHKDSAVTTGADAGWVDRVRVTPLPSLGEALDNVALAWSSSGSQDWLGQGWDAWYGGSSARSGAIAQYQTSSLTTSVEGPGVVGFYWKISATTFNYLELWVDGKLNRKIGGSKNWTQQGFYVGPGTHALEWRYNKTSPFVDGQDAAWVDKVTFTPGQAGAEDTWSLYH